MLVPITVRRLEWATLYTKVRRLADSLAANDDRSLHANSLISVLRAYDVVRNRQPNLADSLWETGQQLAAKLQLK